ncbi:MAG: B12-binding domain-containing radical SAM protein [Chitinophagaceae bacterium]|nr:B12-binding domain-containing radical SAM protein [Chitinophagaceae bacterium]
MNKVLLFNPRATNFKPRIPNSVLQVAASIDGIFDYAIVDGNIEKDPWQKILLYLQTDTFNCFALSVMPGPQLKQAIPFSKKVKALFPEVIIIWGGYFASNQSGVVLNAGYVDYVVYGPGDKTFPQLLQLLQRNEGKVEAIKQVNNLIFKDGEQIIKTAKDELYDQDELPPLPYQKLDTFYPIKKYLGKTYLGNHTIAYHSSIGCPFKCAFCGIVPIFNARWKGKSAISIYNDIKYLKENFGGDAIEFHDNNFFVSEKRTVEFSNLIRKENVVWWGEGRIDTIDKYEDASIAAMREAGCKMIFFGAETGNDAILKKMDKGGTQTGEQIRKFAARMSKFDIIPEYSFVLGTPGDTEEEVNRQIDEDIAFIREIKSINPKTEIIIYVYSPVPTEGSELFNRVKAQGFHFPETLEDWISPHWENFDLRKNPLTPWLKPYMIDKIKNFETVLNGYYPTVSDVKLTSINKKIISGFSSLRYHLQWYQFPYEIKALQKFWLKYRQPEVEGF